MLFFHRYYFFFLTLYLSPVFCTVTQHFHEVNQLQHILKSEVYNQGGVITEINQQRINLLIEKIANYIIAKYLYLPYPKVKERYRAVANDVPNRANNPQSLQDLQDYLDQEYAKRAQHKYINASRDNRPYHGGVHASIVILLFDNIMPWYKQYWNKQEEIAELKRDIELYMLSKLAVFFHDTHNIAPPEDIKDLNCVFFEYEMKKAGFDEEKIKRVSDALSKKDAKPLGDQCIQTAGVHDCDCIEIIRIFGAFYDTLASAIQTVHSQFGKNYLTIYPFMVAKKGKEEADRIINDFMEQHTQIVFHFMGNQEAIRDQCQKDYDRTYTAVCEEIKKCQPTFKLPDFGDSLDHTVLLNAEIIQDDNEANDLNTDEPDPIEPKNKWQYIYIIMIAVSLALGAVLVYFQKPIKEYLTSGLGKQPKMVASSSSLLDVYK